MEEPKIAIIGAGLSGIDLSLSLAEKGFKVILIEKEPQILGLLSKLDKQFPTNDCTLCQILPTHSRSLESDFCLRREVKHPNLEIITHAEVLKIEGNFPDFSLEYKKRNSFVLPSLCINCDKCVEVCPVEVYDEFNSPFGKRKAIFTLYPSPTPRSYVIDETVCTKCGKCVEVCPTNAIDLTKKEESEKIKINSVVFAGGLSLVKPEEYSQYGYGLYKNVITNLQLERILSPIGATQGEILRPSDNKKPQKIAFLQCIGSRDHKREYCSSICCMYAFKEGYLIKEDNPDAEVHYFFMDRRAYGKDYYEYYENLKDNKSISFTRGRVSHLFEDSNNDLIVYFEENNKLRKEKFDMVVLSVGQEVPEGFKKLYKETQLETDSYGYLKGKNFSYFETTKDGIFGVSALFEPIDISLTVTQTKALSGEIETKLFKHFSLKKEEFKENFQIKEEWEYKAGIYLCSCKRQNEEKVDFESLKISLKNSLNDPRIEEFEISDELCLQSGLKAFIEKIKPLGLTHLLVASCSPYHYQKQIEDSLKNIGINPLNLKIVPLREHVSLVHNDKKEATEKAFSLIKSGVFALLEESAPLREVIKIEPLKEKANNENSKYIYTHTAVIGGGPSGLEAALEIADKDFHVALVEKENSLGGEGAKLNYNLDNEPKKIVDDLIQKTINHPKITVLLNSKPTSYSGSLLNFTLDIETENGLKTIYSSNIILAAGTKEAETSEYLYKERKEVITQREFERNITDEEIRKLKRVLMIQCVESRDENRPYCSRNCCMQALKNALRIKNINREAEVFVLYRDMMSYGLNEKFYKEAREKGVYFIPYDVDKKPSVFEREKRLFFEAEDETMQRKIELPVDFVVLSVGVDTNPEIYNAFPEFKGKNGFLKEQNYKYLPQNSKVKGIFLAGSANGPKNLKDSIIEGRAAASKVLEILEDSEIIARRQIAEVNPKLCSGCGYCVEACPVSARYIDIDDQVAYVRNELCVGCFNCASVCPSSATAIKGYSFKKALDEITVLLY